MLTLSNKGRNCASTFTLNFTSSELRAVTLSHIMTNNEQKLRKANKEFKDEVAELKVKVEKVLKELSERTEECKLNVGNGGEVLSPDKTKSVEVVLDQYNDLIAFKVSASKELEEIRARLDKISETCDHIQKSLDAFEPYSYHFKIWNGIPQILKERPKKAFKRSLKEMLLDILQGHPTNTFLKMSR